MTSTDLLLFYLILAILGLIITIIALPTMIYGPKDQKPSKK